MKLITRLVFTMAIISLASCLVGCINTKSGNPIDQSKVSQIQKGVTTKDQVVALFGQPLSSQLMGDGRRMMIYHFSQTSGFVGTPFGGGHGETSTQMLQIILNKDSIVEDYEFSTGANKIR